MAKYLNFGPKENLRKAFLVFSILFAAAWYYGLRGGVPDSDVSSFAAGPPVYCKIAGTVVSFPENLKNRSEFLLKCNTLVKDGDTFRVT